MISYTNLISYLYIGWEVKIRCELEYLVFVRSLTTMGGIDDNKSYSSLNKTKKKNGQYYPRKNVNTNKETQQKTQACD
jgi:hypothetical protein